MIVFKDKQKLRLYVHEQRVSIDKNDKEQWDQSIEQTILMHPIYRKSQNLFIYVSKLDEVRTTTIIDHAIQQGKNIIIPRVTGPMRMSLHYFQGWQELEQNKMGIYEPKKTAPKANLATIDCAIVPTLACSKNKDRLGYGGGYYDFFLKEYDFPKIALCYEHFIFDEIPTRRFDVPMDCIISEEKTYE